MDTPYQIYHNPASRFVANFVGKADFIPSTVQGNLLISKIGRFYTDGETYPDSSMVDLMIRPDDVTLTPDPNGNAVITDVRFLGSDVLYELELPDKTYLHSLGLSVNFIPKGIKVKFEIDLPHTVFFPRETWP